MASPGASHQRRVGGLDSLICSVGARRICRAGRVLSVHKLRNRGITRGMAYQSHCQFRTNNIFLALLRNEKLEHLMDFEELLGLLILGAIGSLVIFILYSGFTL